jgi:hypothetical protein
MSIVCDPGLSGSRPAPRVERLFLLLILFQQVRQKPQQYISTVFSKISHQLKVCYVIIIG